MQYDALISPEFQALMDDCKDICEIGLWLEVVEPMVSAIGEKWNGRYPWDWYCDVGFLIGYEPQVRIKLIDEAMGKFKEIYGKYPDSVGSWHIDAVSMKHLSEKYGVSACCICRDQVGTDGYTMQGGYYNQAYYPSVNNMFCPASTEENQINMPVFRMLGTDPVYEYDRQLFSYGIKRCATLEAAQLGHDPSWCDWFLENLFNGNGLCFQYTQAGQENSFGWEKMNEGIEYQFPKLAQMEREGKITVMTLGESGRYYKESYKITPAAAIAVNTAWNDPSRSSVWYYSRFFRANLLMDDGIAKIRDMYLFDEKYEEHYLTKRCDTHACEFRNLPIMDGVIYSNPDKQISAGIYLTQNGTPIKWDLSEYAETTANTAKVTLSCPQGQLEITFSERSVDISTSIEGFSLCPVYDRERVFGSTEFGNEFANHNNRKTNFSFISEADVTEDTLEFTFNGFKYGIRISEGILCEDLTVKAENGKIRVYFS